MSEEAVTWPVVVRMQGIESAVLRSGPFQVTICNYNRSLWARGFCNLWHRDLGDMVFSTLHSLPTTVEKAKLRLDNTDDWAGFPHVQVGQGSTAFHSHRHVENLQIHDSDETEARWTEPLLDNDGNSGGTLQTRLRFRGQALQVQLKLSDLAAPTRLSFHLLKRTQHFAGFWWGGDLDALCEGQWPTGGGWHHDREFDGTEATGVQVNNTVFVLAPRQVPEGTSASATLQPTSGLHTGNLGGAVLRWDLPPNVSTAELTFEFQALPLQFFS